MTKPLVSCVMATANRRRFLPQALRCFLSQSYRNKELIVVDDSARSNAPLFAGVSGVRYLRLTQPTPTGTKLNLGIEAARGDILQKVDDDDFYSPEFLATSVAYFPRRRFTSTLVTRCCFLVLLRDQVLRHSAHGWNPGGTLCFHRRLWRRHPFREIPASEDSYFLYDHNPDIIRLCAPEQYIILRHGRNTWTGMASGETADDFFSRHPAYHKPLDRLVPPETVRLYRRLLSRACHY